MTTLPILYICLKKNPRWPIVKKTHVRIKPFDGAMEVSAELFFVRPFFKVS